MSHYRKFRFSTIIGNISMCWYKDFYFSFFSSRPFQEYVGRCAVVRQHMNTPFQFRCSPSLLGVSWEYTPLSSHALSITGQLICLFCAILGDIIPWEANMCWRRWICAIGGGFVTWKANLYHRRLIPAVEGEFVYRERQVCAVKICTMKGKFIL